MKKMSNLLFAILLFAGLMTTIGLSIKNAEAKKNPNTVYVYGPGGPLGPMEELAKRYSKGKGIQVHVTGGPEGKWIEQAKKDGDIIYGGSSYMLQNFSFSHPELLDEESWVELYSRPAGILVRKGNPKNIHSMKDLAKDGVRIVDVNGAGQLGLWEDLAGRESLIPDIRKNIATSVKTSAEAIELWKSDSTIDAWITYESWHYRLQDVTDLVKLKDKLYRGTPIALTEKGSKNKQAVKFLAFLQTEEAQEVFRKWGWKGPALQVLSHDKIDDYLADDKGMTLYYFKNDVEGKSNCTGDCLANWPIVKAGEYEVPAGYDKADFGKITREDNGEEQLTYKGYPLYYFTKDISQGDVNGEGVKDVWYVVNDETEFE
ncbi:MAG TPA: substrate-binding domain-containing protein [Sporosarcina sp.]|nr:substrate-binding domain-containing protein [Sporosarcina sp.]